MVQSTTMIVALLLCTALSVFLVMIMRTRMKQTQVYNDPPVGSLSWPIIGITFQLIMSNAIKYWEVIKMLAEDTAKQGGVTKIKMAWYTCYCITDPEDAATVANACLEKNYMYKFGESLVGQSLLTAPVPVWTHHRKLLNPAFSLPMIHGFMEIFNDQATKLADEMFTFAGKGPFDATSSLKENVFKTSCLTAFGGSNMHDEKTFQTYLNSLDEFTQLIVRRSQRVWQYSDFIYKLLGLKKKQDKLVKNITQISNEIIEKVQKATSNQPISNFDDRQTGVTTFLDMYIKINKNNDLTAKELREELEITIGAAFDTTSFQLQNILVLLGSYPKIQERVFNEILHVIGPDRPVDKEDLRKLVYTDAVMKEAVRFLPITPVVARSVNQDVTLKNCTLRGGTQAIILLYGMNRHSSWGPDADQFRPERWLEPKGVPDMPSAFATFSIGKRGCIGKTYALTSLKVTIAHIVRKYQIKADYTKMQFKFDVVVKPVKGHDITLTCRNHNKIE